MGNHYRIYIFSLNKGIIIGVEKSKPFDETDLLGWSIKVVGFTDGGSGQVHKSIREQLLVGILQIFICPSPIFYPALPDFHVAPQITMPFNYAIPHVSGKKLAPHIFPA